MQMVSASKMRKAQTATLASRTYSDLAWKLIRSLGALPEQQAAHALREVPALMAPKPGSRKTLIVIISTNRGQVGSFNTNLFAKLKSFEAEVGVGHIDYAIMGRKAIDIATRLHRPIVADFTKLDTLPTAAHITPLAQWLCNEFTKGTYRTVVVVYNHFISTLTQQVRVQPLLPLAPSAESTGETVSAEYEYEPNPSEVLKALLPRIVESQLYQALLESDASEHSARMVMMKNATENAGDLIADLTLTFNQLRQNKITTELSEITAGKIALENI